MFVKNGIDVMSIGVVAASYVGQDLNCGNGLQRFGDSFHGDSTFADDVHTFDANVHIIIYANFHTTIVTVTVTVTDSFCVVSK